MSAEAPQYISADEEAEQARQRDKRRREHEAEVEKFIDEWIEKLPDQFYSADYLAKWRDRPVTVSFLSEALGLLRKRVHRLLLREIIEVSDDHGGHNLSHRKRFQTLEAELATLKASVARGFNLRGTFSTDANYSALDVVALDGGSFAARRDNPGPCPGDGWQLLVQRGKPGKPGQDGKYIHREVKS